MNDPQKQNTADNGVGSTGGSALCVFSIRWDIDLSGPCGCRAKVEYYDDLHKAWRPVCGRHAKGRQLTRPLPNAKSSQPGT